MRRTVALGDIATIERTVRAPSDIVSGSIYVGLENIERGGELVDVQPVGAGVLASAKFDFTEKHILYGKLRPYLRKIALPDFRGVCSTDILPILPGPEVDRSYLARFLRQPAIVALATARSVGANLPRLNPAELARFRIPLPPIQEQRRIAAVLDQADEVRAKRRAAIVLLDSLIESIFLDTFGRDENQWPVATIESLAAEVPNAIRTGPFGSQLLHSEFVDEGVAVLGIDNAVQDRFVWAKPRYITLTKFQELRRFQVRPGDVVVTIMGTCGRVAVVPDDIPTAINTKHLCCITLDRARCLPAFLWACFRFDRGLRRQLGATARGAVMPGLNMGLIKAGRVLLPPIDLQREFGRRLEQVVLLRDRSSRAEEETKALFASLEHRAFSRAL